MHATDNSIDARRGQIKHGGATLIAFNVRMTCPNKVQTLGKKIQRWIADGDEFGGNRRSLTLPREATKAMDHNALIPDEPVTVILSTKGWIRAAKGHEVDAENLNFKSGDPFLCLV